MLDDLFDARAPSSSVCCPGGRPSTPTSAALAVILDEPPDVGALARLAERYPRLVQTDGNGAWTFHAGLRTFLPSRLAREGGSAGTPGLHARAAAHYEEREEWSRAVDHLLGAHAWSDAARILERQGDLLLERDAPQRWSPTSTRCRRPSHVALSSAGFARRPTGSAVRRGAPCAIAESS